MNTSKFWQWMALGAMFFGIGSGCAAVINANNQKKVEDRLDNYVRGSIEDFFDYNFQKIDEKPNEKRAKNAIIICHLSKDYQVSKNEANKEELEIILHDKKEDKRFAVTAPKEEGISVILYPLIPTEAAGETKNKYSCLASAYYYYCTGEYNKAQEKLSKLEQDVNVKHVVYDILGDIATAQDNFKIADKCYNDALKTLEKNHKSGLINKQDYLKNKIFYLLDKASMNYKEDNNKKAIKNLLKALNLTNNLEQDKEVMTAITLYSLGTFYHKIGDYPRAINNLSKADSLLKGDNIMQQNAIIKVYEEIAQVYCEMKEYDKATKFIRMSETLKKITVPLMDRVRFDF